MFRGLQQHGTGFYPVRMASISTLTGDFSCRPEVQAFYAELGLPPSPEAFICE